MPDSPDAAEVRVAMVTGASAGLGFHTAQALLGQGYRVVLVGRDQGRLDQAHQKIPPQQRDRAYPIAADVTEKDAVGGLLADVQNRFGRLDVLVNCVGASDRGLVENLTNERLQELMLQNVTTTLLCSQASLEMLESSGGVIVNIGSLASKVGARYVGGYSAAKHALAGLSAQMRLELKPRGVHVALICPGPIRRPDAGTRYQERLGDDLPAQAGQPGAGARIKGIPPQRVAAAIVRAIDRRRCDVVLPGHLRILIALGNAFPSLGDWMLLKFTSSKASDQEKS